MKSPWEPVLRDRGTDQTWELFKDIFHGELSNPRCKKPGRTGREWLSRDLLLKSRKKEMHSQWKQEYVPWDMVWMCIHVLICLESHTNTNVNVTYCSFS